LNESVIRLPDLDLDAKLLSELGRRFFRSSSAKQYFQESEHLSLIALEFCDWIEESFGKKNTQVSAEKIKLLFFSQKSKHYSKQVAFDKWIITANAKPSEDKESTINIFFSQDMFVSWFFLYTVHGLDELDAVWNSFVMRDLMPTIKHELTHLYQIKKMWLNGKKFTEIYYQTILKREGRSSYFWQSYFGDKQEITAHAVEAIEIARGLGIKENSMLEMIKTTQGVSKLQNLGVKPLSLYIEVFPSPTHPVRKRFFKTLTQILQLRLTELSLEEKIVKFANRQNASIETIHALLTEVSSEHKIVSKILF